MNTSSQQSQYIKLPVIALDETLNEAARDLAQKWGLEFSSSPGSESDYMLCLTPQRLELRSASNRQGPVYVDFTKGAVGYRYKHGGGRKQHLAVAAGFKKNALPSILDATAGFARDAFVYASLGSRVQLLERSPVVAALLEDGIRRAVMHEQYSELLINGRFDLVHTNAIDFISALTEEDFPDVIYIDPMYPKNNKSASVKKEMAVFRDIIGQDIDADELLAVSLKKAGKRVVVKRPDYAPWLNGLKPDVDISMSKHRFDVYFTGLCS